MRRPDRDISYMWHMLKTLEKIGIVKSWHQRDARINRVSLYIEWRDRER
jgi:hypothetical protein